MSHVPHGSKANNRLADARSPYLRSAANQPVEWYPWGEEAFAEAKRRNKPILLDIGAVWCHWCHVIDHESYENGETAKLINALYVPIKVDRDERPDVDARYQQAVAALAGQGGWPLTGFLTPEGDMFWGGTYFPPKDMHGRPGFPRVLREVAAFYREHPDDARKQGEQIRSALHQTAETEPGSAPLRAELIEEALEKIRREHDAAHGGFGQQPKFPHPSAIDLLLRRFALTGDQSLLAIATHTLRSMGRGGVYDQIGGGFHRYSVDERWVVPHFEKMLYDNAGLLRNYAWAYALTGDEFFKEIAEGIIGYLDTLGSDRKMGGFYASQDADIGLTDDGDYWTWTVKEAKAALDEEQFAVAQRYYDLYEQGEMHIDPSRNVLFIAKDIPEIAEELGVERAEVERRLDAAKRKLSEARAKRNMPYVDATIYLNWNGMMVAAYLDAARLLDIPACRQFALATLDRLLAEGSTDGGAMLHRLGDSAGRQTVTLDDQVQIGLACIAAYETTGDGDYLDRAKRLAKVMRERFWDATLWGFFDTPPREEDVEFLQTPVKPIQDSPNASANGCAVQFYEKLSRITDDGTYRQAAEQTLRAFAEHASRLGLLGAAYFLGLDQFLNPPPVAVIVGPATSSRTSSLRNALLRVPRWGGAVVTHDPTVRGAAPLPAAVKAMVDRYEPSTGPQAYVCSGTSCGPPTGDTDEAVEAFRNAGRSDRR